MQGLVFDIFKRADDFKALSFLQLLNLYGSVYFLSTIALGKATFDIPPYFPRRF